MTPSTPGPEGLGNLPGQEGSTLVGASEATDPSIADKNDSNTGEPWTSSASSLVEQGLKGNIVNETVPEAPPGFLARRKVLGFIAGSGVSLALAILQPWNDSGPQTTAPVPQPNIRTTPTLAPSPEATASSPEAAKGRADELAELRKQRSEYVPPLRTERDPQIVIDQAFITPLDLAITAYYDTGLTEKQRNADVERVFAHFGPYTKAIKEWMERIITFDRDPKNTYGFDLTAQDSRFLRRFVERPLESDAGRFQNGGLTLSAGGIAVHTPKLVFATYIQDLSGVPAINGSYMELHSAINLWMGAEINESRWGVDSFDGTRPPTLHRVANKYGNPSTTPFIS